MRERHFILNDIDFGVIGPYEFGMHRRIEVFEINDGHISTIVVGHEFPTTERDCRELEEMMANRLILERMASERSEYEEEDD